MNKKYIFFLSFITILLPFLQENSYAISRNSNDLVILQHIDSTSLVDTKTSSGENQKYYDYQDSLYKKFLSLNVTSRTLFNFNLSLTEDAWNNILNNTSELPYQSALSSLNAVPSVAFIPTGVEMMNYQANLDAASYIPFVNKPNYGVRVPLRDIGVFLGLVEDTSPEIVYSLDGSNEVEIVIYSIQAKVIATLYKAIQRPGKFKITWNFRDDNGRLMPSGDYIAEVRIGNSKFIRKRIVIP
ncbi:MAG: hypothetical protein A2X64_01485 [Ignavibacteria bacterium GWF2_33_9]|nr:MAG: hypothetical protein A2X64_01485 [Ignavibacteria bacterium GWF2_33_9]